MPRKALQPSSETRLLELLQARYPSKTRLIKKGIGDDAAVVRLRGAQEFWLITTDMLVENIDFRRAWITPRRLGAKSLSVNLSDLAAMGARPRFFTISLAIPSDISERWILEFHDGITAKGNYSGAYLIGGDLSRSEKHIVISITAIGESLNRIVLYRSGGKPGDLLYVTGVLGRSAAGLKLLEAGQAYPRSRFAKTALQAHQQPEARLDAGLWLAQSGLASCMMDLSDGLSMDLPRLCACSGVGAEVRISDLPVFLESRLWGLDPVELALHGGEDFELLFAVPKSKQRLLEKNYPATLTPITKIGELTGDAGKVWIAEENKKRYRLPQRGYDHFRRLKAQ
jgi:thiamine-monophosphate kinase